MKSRARHRVRGGNGRPAATLRSVLVVLALSVVPGTPAASAGDGAEPRSLYVTMRDSVRIAIDVHLPAAAHAGTKVPTIVRQTRYWRRWEFKWPASLFLSDMHNGPTRARFLAEGYAWVDVDVRGSGTSFGHQICSYSPDEIRDGAEVVDWIVAQPWSNGQVGSTGISYDGTAAEFLLLNHHPAVRAIAPRFSNYDAYADIVYPGGIHHSWFTESWGRLNKAQDGHVFHEYRGPLAWFAVKGPMPVDADGGRRLLAAAREAHAANFDVHEETSALRYRDDLSPNDPFGGVATPDLAGTPTSLTGTIGIMSPHSYRGDLEASGAAILSYSGWWDGAYPHAAVKRFLTVRTPGSRLILGPWDHGGWHRITPHTKTEPHVFDHDAMLLAFFDLHLKSIDRGIGATPPVMYFTMGEQRWKHAETWPPPEAKTVDLYFAAGGTLGAVAPTDEADATDRYEVDPTAGTSHRSRWDTLLNLEQRDLSYEPRGDADAKLLTYTSPPLARDLEVTGHPVVTLHIRSSAADGHFFAYLEDVDAGGKVAMVTEGLLGAVHRKLSDRTPPYRTPAPYRTFTRADAAPLVPGEPAELVFDLLPTSYRFGKGHRIRIAIAGADADHFAPSPDPAPTLDLLRTGARASRIALPVIGEIATALFEVEAR